MSRKIDELIAVNIMQWHRRLKTDVYEIDRELTEDDGWLEGFDNHWYDAANTDMGCVEDDGCCRDDYEDGWSPSNDYSAAFEVVENMKLTHDPCLNWYMNQWVCILNASEDKEDQETVTCGDGYRTRYRRRISMSHESACMAICLCALRAHGIPESTIQESLQ